MISLDDQKHKNSANRRLFSLSKKESKVNREDKDDNSDTFKIFLDCLKKSCSETTAHAIPNIGLYKLALFYHYIILLK
jgi:hypothetical protein